MMTKKSAKVLMSFPAALTALIAGSKITKEEWANEAIYGELKDGKVQIMRGDGDGLYHPWIISDGDLAGQDWYILT